MITHLSLTTALVQVYELLICQQQIHFSRNIYVFLFLVTVAVALMSQIYYIDAVASLAVFLLSICLHKQVSRVLMARHPRTVQHIIRGLGILLVLWVGPTSYLFWENRYVCSLAHHHTGR